MSRKEKLLGKTGDEIALEILMDPTLTQEQRDKKLADAYAKFSKTVMKKIRR